MAKPDAKHKAQTKGAGFPQADPLPPELLRSGIATLLGSGAHDAAIDTFLLQAPNAGIDPTLLVGTVHAGRVGQVCLPVLGAGRTIMLFLSPGEGARDLDERRAAIVAAVQAAHDLAPERTHLVQALADPRDDAASEAFQAAGLAGIAELRYLSLRLEAPTGPRPCPDAPVSPPMGQTWPEDVTVETLDGMPGPDHPELRAALESTYAETLDCPELTGMRTTEDIIDAHLQVGEFDPSLWWLIKHRGEPLGCVLLNPSVGSVSVELVYIGIAPSLRGLGLGGGLLRKAIESLGGSRERDLRCAVDARNVPARRMYARLGFRETEARRAFVALAQDLLDV